MAPLPRMIRGTPSPVLREASRRFVDQVLSDAKARLQRGVPQIHLHLAARHRALDQHGGDEISSVTAEIHCEQWLLCCVWDESLTSSGDNLHHLSVPRPELCPPPVLHQHLQDGRLNQHHSPH